jgi:hypothetical protein
MEIKILGVYVRVAKKVVRRRRSVNTYHVKLFYSAAF